MNRLWKYGYRAIEIPLIAVGIAWLAVTNGLASVLLLAGWDVLAFVYCLARWLRVRSHRMDTDEPGDGSPSWLHSLLGRGSGSARPW
jgi:hypothetical protein